MDVLDKANQTKIKLKTFRKLAEDIENLKVNWNKKLNQHEGAGYQHQEFLNLKKDTQKYELLENLKNQKIPGPFTNSKEIQSYLSKTSESDVEKKRQNEKSQICQNNTGVNILPFWLLDSSCMCYLFPHGIRGAC